MPPVTAVPTDEIHEKYLQKAIAEINELGDEIARAAGGVAVPVLGSGHPLADIFLLKHTPQPSEVQEGVAFFGRAGQAVLKSLQRLRVDPMAVYGTNCVKLAEGAADEEARGWLTRELHIVQPKLVVPMGDDARRLPERPRVPALPARRGDARRAAALHADHRGARRPGHRQLARRGTRPRPRSGTRSRCSAPGGQSCLRTNAGRARSRSSAWLAAGAAWYYAADSVPGAVALVGGRPPRLRADARRLPVRLDRAAARDARAACCRSRPGSRWSRCWRELGDLEVLANVAKLGSRHVLRVLVPRVLRGPRAARRRRADHPVRRRVLGVPRPDREHRRAPLARSSRTSRSTSRCRTSRTTRGSGSPISSSSRSSWRRRCASGCGRAGRGW